MKSYTIGQYFKDNNLALKLNIYCSDNNITSLENLPENFNRCLYCSDNKIKTFKGLPKNFNAYIDCSNNKIVNFEGLPENFNSDIYCDNNKIVNFEGLPKNFNSYIYCDNNVKSLDGIEKTLMSPDNIRGLSQDFIISEFKRLNLTMHLI